MRSPFTTLDRFSQIVLAASTSVLALNVALGWLAGFFANRSAPVLVWFALIYALLSLAMLAVSAYSLYQRGKHRELQRTVDSEIEKWQCVTAEITPQSPISPDCEDLGRLPFESGALDDLYRDAIPIAADTYSDATVVGFSEVLTLGRRPSIWMKFDFFSNNAGAAASVHWNNYDGFTPRARIEREIDLRPLRAWASPPWHAFPNWGRAYRMAYEKAAPFTGPFPQAQLSSNIIDPSEGGAWTFRFFGTSVPRPAGGKLPRTFVMTVEGNVKEGNAARYASHLGLVCARRNFDDVYETRGVLAMRSIECSFRINMRDDGKANTPAAPPPPGGSPPGPDAPPPPHPEPPPAAAPLAGLALAHVEEHRHRALGEARRELRHQRPHRLEAVRAAVDRLEVGLIPQGRSVAAGGGIEPPLRDSKSPVLPLDDPAEMARKRCYINVSS